MEVSDRVLTGDIRVIARLMTDIENKMPEAVETLGKLYPHTGKAHIVGITGVPGGGKSTVINAAIGSLRRRGMTVGVVAVDPSSPFTGGALLGDRVRMQGHSTDEGVFVRSLATRGGIGGLSRAALSMVHVLDAMGKDIVLVETVGIGQSEIEVTKITDTSVLVLVPGMGDTIQLMKCGILEAADIFVVNKAHQDGADLLKYELEGMMTDKNRRPVILTEALLGEGIEVLVDNILEHKQKLISSGELEKRRRARARHELMSAVESSISNFCEVELDEDLERLTDALVQGKTNPISAAQEMINSVIKRTKVTAK
ncbi:MAG: methylmalonyl Co-A mutase-associated GTPase MeaB [Chloroflexota bacterium]